MSGHRELHLELLLGTRVRDRDGRSVGRIEEVLARRDGTTCVVSAYLLGAYGLIGRLAAWRVTRPLLSSLMSGRRQPRRVPWDKLDLRDPAHPRLTCAREDLEQDA
jgi:hypothetical protein